MRHKQRTPFLGSSVGRSRRLYMRIYTEFNHTSAHLILTFAYDHSPIMSSSYSQYYHFACMILPVIRYHELALL